MGQAGNRAALTNLVGALRVAELRKGQGQTGGFQSFPSSGALAYSLISGVFY
jgi:hypothetical protein